MNCSDVSNWRVRTGWWEAVPGESSRSSGQSNEGQESLSDLMSSWWSCSSVWPWVMQLTSSQTCGTFNRTKEERFWIFTRTLFTNYTPSWKHSTDDKINRNNKTVTLQGVCNWNVQLIQTRLLQHSKVQRVSHTHCTHKMLSLAQKQKRALGRHSSYHSVGRFSELFPDFAHVLLQLEDLIVSEVRRSSVFYPMAGWLDNQELVGEVYH